MRSAKHDLTFWGTFITLYLFWIVITGSLQKQQLLVGAVLAFFVAWMNNDELFRKDERSLLDIKTVFLYLRYALHLIAAIVRANLQVAAIVLNPKMPISPGMIRFTRPFKKNLNKVILANSITLTPGTLTVLIDGEDFLVHALTRANAEEVVRWELAEELAEIERFQEGA